MTRIFYKYFVFQHSFSFSQFQLQGQHTLSSVTSRENIITLSFQLTAVNRHKIVYAIQTFFFSLYFVGEIFSSLENRNFVKPQKKQPVEIRSQHA